MADDKSVQVALRIRPLVDSELDKGCQNVLEVFPELAQVRLKNTDKAFTYNYIFGPTSAQDEIYNTSVQHLVDNLFKGYNVTILAYGQTGSGKTYSMGTMYNGVGDGEGQMGVIPRAVRDIFQNIHEQFSYDFRINVSFMELYQETLYDLLANKPREQCALEIREDSNKEIVIPGLTEIPVNEAKEVFDILARGSLGRATASTNMNTQSSRSHAIFTINMCIVNRNNSHENKTAKLNLVDLAGSERPKKTGAVGTTFKEGVNINKGLLVLGNVISALGDDKQHSYIPYRDSNLTRLLKDCLGGNSLTLMIACVSPADYNYDETVSTLRYADRARRIQNKPVINQDAKAAQISELKKTIEQLKLQILGQGGPIICPAEIELLKRQNNELAQKYRDLTVQLSSTINDNTGLLEKIIIMQNASEMLHNKIKQLKEDYDDVLNKIFNGCDLDNIDVIKNNLIILQRIQEQFNEIEMEKNKIETELRNHEESISQNNSINCAHIHSETFISKETENHTNNQMALNIRLQQLSKELAVKESLAMHILTNNQYLVDYQAMNEHQEKITALEKEKEELLQQLKSAHIQGVSQKISEQRQKRVHDLEKQIQDLHKKLREQAQLIKLKEKDEKKIKQLNTEILAVKQNRVKLIRTMREESDRFRVWKQQRERELSKLKEQDRKKQNEIVKLQVMHSKQQNVLKRKVEEAAAINRRLKDALALRKNIQHLKTNGKVERLKPWLKEELNVYVSTVEAQSTLTGLMEDRAALQEQLNTLKSDPDNDHTEEIKTIVEDLLLRSTQLQDLQQKILDSDEENKANTRFDNIQTMSEAKYALKVLFELVANIKKNEVESKMKLIESQAKESELNKQIEEMERIEKVVDYKHSNDIAKVHEEYEEKVALLLKQLRGTHIDGDADERLQQVCAMQEEKIDKLMEKNQKLMGQIYEHQQQIEDLTKRLDVVGQQIAQEIKSPLQEVNKDLFKPLNDETFLTPVRKPIKVRVQKNADDTFTIDENWDEDFDEIDNQEKDPDWRNTPIGKFLATRKRRIRSTNIIANEKDTTMNETRGVKRTSENGCMCLKSNCSKRCGCKKYNQSCTNSCKCLAENCMNRASDRQSSEGETNEGHTFKKPRARPENE